MKKILFLAFLCLLTYNSLAQDEYKSYFDSIKVVLSKTSKSSEQFKIFSELSEVYRVIGKLDSSRILKMKMLKIAIDSHNLSQQEMTYLLLGADFADTSDYLQSLKFQFKSLELAKTNKNISGIWIAYKEIGVDYKLIKNYPEALKYLLKAKSYLKQLKQKDIEVEKSRTYTNLSDIYLALGNNNQALKYIQLANECTSKKNDLYGFATVQYIFAKIYKERGDSEIAESYFKKCITFTEETDLAFTYVIATEHYGHYLYENKQYNLAKQYTCKSFAKALQSKNKLGVINASSLLRKIYADLKQKDSSYYYADIKEVYRDSVFNEQQTNQIQNISFAQQIKEKEEEVKLLEEDEQRKQNIQYTFIALGIIIFLTLFLLLSQTIIVNQKSISFLSILGLLAVFEFINLLIHPFLEKITHHSPILMLISLILLASLLIPLHHKLEHIIKHKLTEKNKAIRLAAAKKTIEQLEEE